MSKSLEVRLRRRENLEGDDQTTGGIVAQFEASCVAVKTGETRARIGQTQSSATAPFEISVDLNTRAVILNFNPNDPVTRNSRDFDAAGLSFRWRAASRSRRSAGGSVGYADVEYFRIDLNVSR